MMRNYHLSLILLSFVAFDVAVFGIDENPTTTSENPCLFAAQNAGIFIEVGVDLAAWVYGRKNASGTCESCQSGTQTFYTSASTAVPQWSEEAIGSLSFESCTNTCVCDVNETCYTLSSTYTVLTLWPYCSSSNSCNVYGVLTSDSDNDGLVAVGETTPSFTAGAQIDVDGTVGDKYAPFPVTYSCYPQIVSVSYNGCPITTCTN